MKIGQCGVCKAPVLLDDSNGWKAAASVTRLTRQEAVAVLLGGRSLYVVRVVDGRPRGLQYATQRRLSLLGDDDWLTADHPCAPASSMRPVMPDPHPTPAGGNGRARADRRSDEPVATVRLEDLSGFLSASQKPGPTAPPRAPSEARTTPFPGPQGASVDDAEARASSVRLIVDTLGATVIKEG